MRTIRLLFALILGSLVSLAWGQSITIHSISPQPMVKGQTAIMLYSTTGIAPGAPLQVFGISTRDKPPVRLRLYDTTNTGNFTFTVIINNFESGVDYFMSLLDPASGAEGNFTIRLQGPYIKLRVDGAQLTTIFVPGETFTIPWKGVQLDGRTAKLVLYGNDSVVYTIATGIPASQLAYNWTIRDDVPYTDSPTWYQLQLALTDAGYTRVSDFSYYIRIYSADVRFTFPSVYYSMLVKQVPVTVTWTVLGQVTTTLNLDLVSEADVSVVVDNIQNGISAGAGQYVWTPRGTLPTFSTTGNGLRLRFSSSGVGGFTFYSNPFLITTVGFAVTIDSGDQDFLETGRPYTLSWTTVGVSSTVSIGADQSATTTAQNIIATGIPNTGSYTYTPQPNAAIAASATGIPLRLYVIAGSDPLSFSTLITTQRNGHVDVLGPFRLHHGRTNTITYNVVSAVASPSTVDCVVTDYDGQVIAPLVAAQPNTGSFSYFLPIGQAPFDSATGNELVVRASTDASITGSLRIAVVTWPNITFTSQPPSTVAVGDSITVSFSVTIAPSAAIFAEVIRVSDNVRTAVINGGSAVTSPLTFVLTSAMAPTPGPFRIRLSNAGALSQTVSGSFTATGTSGPASGSGSGSGSGSASATGSGGATGTTTGAGPATGSGLPVTGTTTGSVPGATTSTGSPAATTTTGSSTSSSGLQNSQNSAAVSGTMPAVVLTIVLAVLLALVGC